MSYPDWLTQRNLPHAAWTFERWFREETAAGRPPEIEAELEEKRAVIIEEFRALAEIHGRTPTAEQITVARRDGLISHGPHYLRQLFGSLAELSSRAGLQPNASTWKTNEQRLKRKEPEPTIVLEPSRREEPRARSREARTAEAARRIA